MPEEAFGELYALRWRIEVHYGQEKYTLEIENFSGTTPRVIEQDDHATILFANLSAAVKQEAEQQWDAHRDQYHRKYDRYRINYKWLIATVKYRMIQWLWAKTAEDFERQPRRFQRTIVRLMRDMVPVIPGIITPRNQKRGRTNKFVITLRRSLSRRSRACPNPNPRASTTTFEKMCKFRRAASCWSNDATYY